VEAGREIALEVRGLTRLYGSRAAIRSLDLTVHAGDVYGFLGPNGAGKTTAMRCILGLIRRSEGTVSIFGERDPVKARRLVGAIVETPAFHDWLSGLDNLRLAAAYAGLAGAAAEAEIGRVLDRVGLVERARDPAGNYSLGMRQRLANARALLGKPRLLLLDEPTNGLDPRGMREVRDLVRSLALNDRITVLISSHLLVEIQAICNRVGILQDGMLKAEGRVDQLLAGEAAPQRIIEIGSSDGAKLAAAIGSLAGVELVGPGENGRTRVAILEGEPAAILRALVEAGVPVDAFVPDTRSLEDVFLAVTR
jgi:ABC-2 type transport system ATP-binding protein